MLSQVTFAALLLASALATATLSSREGCWYIYHTSVNNPEERRIRKTLGTYNKAQEQCTEECKAEDKEFRHRLLEELTSKLTAPQPLACFVEVPDYCGTLVEADRDRSIGTAHRPHIKNPPASILLLDSSHSLAVTMPIGELADIFETSCPNTPATTFNDPTTLQIPPTLMAPTTIIVAEDLEPWITFLFERLAEVWPWILDITPQQIHTLSRLLAALVERVIPNQNLYAETGVDIQATVEEIILNTMKPEQVQ